MKATSDLDYGPEDEQALLEGDTVHGRVTIVHCSRRRLIVLAVLVQALLVFVYSAVFWAALNGFRDDTCSATWLPLAAGHLPLPAKDAMKLEPRPFLTSLKDDNPFAGRPRPELEKAWHDLLRNDNIQVPAKDLEALNLTSIPVKGSEDVIVELGAFHALHCLKKTRQMVYSSHYHEGKDEKTLHRELIHVNHCIEYIREYLMCHPDLSLITFHWINQTSKFEPEVLMPTTWDNSVHECASWDALDEWAGQRYFDLYDVDRLLKPE